MNYEARLLSLRDGRKLVVGRYVSQSLQVDLQFCRQIGHWVFGSMPPGYWQAGQKLSKLAFLLETGRDLETSVEEFVKRNITF